MSEPAFASSAVEAELKSSETRAHPVIVVDGPTNVGVPRRGASIVCVAGDERGRTVRLDDNALEIGRGAPGLSLTSSEISRRHARIRRGPGGHVLEDLGSANGTLLNGERIRTPAVLTAGDRIQVGHTVLVYALQDELEERMERLEKLEALGTLANGIAHDFNNALSVILGNLSFVEDAVPHEDADARESLDAIRKATMSATSLAKRLVRLGSRDPMTVGAVKLAPLVEQTVKVAARRAEVKPAVDLDIPADVVVLGSFDELQHAFVNLFINACDAMPSGGTFRVRARTVHLDRAAATSHHIESPGEYVEILVSDTGCGMDETTRTRLFEPFFTTKGRGKGTGLGLAQVHGTVRRHGGAIEVDSTLGVGTTFQIILQRAR